MDLKNVELLFQRRLNKYVINIIIKLSRLLCSFLSSGVGAVLVSVGHLSFVSTIVITGVTHTLSPPVGQRNLNNKKFRHFTEKLQNFLSFS